MKNSSIITKTALAIAAAALIFSIVTLIRTISIGGNVLVSCALVVGTAVVGAICGVMLYFFNGYTEEDEPEDDAAEDKKAKPTRRAHISDIADDTSPRADAPDLEDSETLEDLDELSDDEISETPSDTVEKSSSKAYDLSIFETPDN